MQTATATCSCGCDTAHVIARRNTFDGRELQFWSDGDVTLVMGFRIRGIGPAKSRYAIDRDIEAGRVLASMATLLDFAEVARAFNVLRNLIDRSRWDCDASIERAAFRALAK